MPDAPDTMAPKRGRKPRFDRAETVSAIADLFWDRGYDGVALSDVMAETGLSKSSLYNSFGDKDDLFRIALSHYHDSVVASGAAWLSADDGTDPWEKLSQLLSGPADDVFGMDADRDTRGCFLCNTSADGRTGTPDIDTIVGDGFARLTDGTYALLRRAAPDASDQTLRATARFIITTYAGMRVRSRFIDTRDELDDVRDMTIDLTRRRLSATS